MSKVPTQDQPSKNTRANKKKSVHNANDTAENEPPLQRNEVNEMIERGIANMIPQLMDALKAYQGSQKRGDETEQTPPEASVKRKTDSNHESDNDSNSKENSKTPWFFC